MRRNRITLICANLICGAEFEIKASLVGRRRFCSKPCQIEGYRAEYPPLPERFWEKVDKDGEHWLWLAMTNHFGHGLFTIRHEDQERAHRVAWELATGVPVPDGLWVLHTCDIPNCVRNDEPGFYEVNGIFRPRLGHLFLGTAADNSADMVAKGRSAAGDRSSARLYPEIYAEARARTDNGWQRRKSTR